MILEDKEEYGLSDVIYEAKCPTCGDQLDFEYNSDADGSSYSTGCCGKFYYASVTKVLVSISDKTI